MDGPVRGAQTAERLRARAIELFSAKGFDATTVEEIARAAGVSHMTFFRHFPTKASVLLDDPYDPLIAASVKAQHQDLAPLERVCKGLLDAWRAMPDLTDRETRARVRITARHPALRARAYENTQRTADALIDTLMESGASRLEAAVAAGAALGAMMAALFEWGSNDDDDSLGTYVGSAMAQLLPPDAVTELGRLR